MFIHDITRFYSFYETYGEDAFVSSKFGTAYIQGSQGNDPSNKTKVATCLKHFIGYSAPLNGLDRSSAWIPEIILREYFLPPFEAGVKAGAMTVMINSGDVNGTPGHANKKYITDILKGFRLLKYLIFSNKKLEIKVNFINTGELGFEGFTVSDWEDVKRLYTRDKVASSPEDAVRVAVMAGIDMSMVPYDFSFHEHCVNLANKSRQFHDRITDATRRILKVKNLVGLFGNKRTASFPILDSLNDINRDDSKEFNLEAAGESIILAANSKNILPLDRNKSMNILVAGPSGNIIRTLNGGWSYSWQGKPTVKPI